MRKLVNEQHYRQCGELHTLRNVDREGTFYHLHVPVLVKKVAER